MKFLATVLSLFNIMVSQCGWCNRLLGFKAGGKGITTGMCRKCLKDFTGEG